MAYARWGETDIYFVRSTYGGIVCMCCPLGNDDYDKALAELNIEFPAAKAFGEVGANGFPNSHTSMTGEEGLAHLRAHVAAGHNVGDAIGRLERDIAAGETFDGRG